MRTNAREAFGFFPSFESTGTLSPPTGPTVDRPLTREAYIRRTPWHERARDFVLLFI